jgi:hypothetical protein
MTKTFLVMQNLIKRMMGPFALFLIVFTLSACNLDNPRADSEAYQTRILAEVAATATAQATEIERQNAMLDLENRQARQAELQLATQRLIYVSGLVAIPVVGFVLIFLGKTTVTTAQGLGDAVVLAAQTRAALIHLDEKTRTFPLLQHVHGERFLVHDPNTGGTTMLDMKNPADRQLIATSGAVRLAGVVAREARQADDPTGVSIATNVPIIGADAAQIIDLQEITHEH